MKTRDLFVVIFLVIGLMLSAGVSAQKPGETILTNVEKNDDGMIKEYIVMDESGKEALKKRVYKFDANDYLTEYTLYEWKQNSGWKPVAKREYIYWESNDLRAVLSSVWDGGKKDWSDKLGCMSYSYDKNLNQVAVKKHSINKMKDMLYAELIKK